MDKVKKLRLIQAGVLLLAVSFIAYGILRGEPEMIFNRAVRICLECIGIG